MYLKWTTPNLHNMNYQYKLGLNVDPHFDHKEYGRCRSHGFYFAKARDIMYWFMFANIQGYTHLCEVEIPKSSRRKNPRVVRYHNKLRTNRLIVHKPYPWYTYIPRILYESPEVRLCTIFITAILMMLLTVIYMVFFWMLSHS